MLDVSLERLLLVRTDLAEYAELGDQCWGVVDCLVTEHDLVDDYLEAASLMALILGKCLQTKFNQSLQAAPRIHVCGYCNRSTVMLVLRLALSMVPQG